MKTTNPPQHLILVKLAILYVNLCNLSGIPLECQISGNQIWTDVADFTQCTRTTVVFQFRIFSIVLSAKSDSDVMNCLHIVIRVL